MKNEKFILYLLTFIWFCAIVDFLLMLPLGTELMHLYHIQPREYSMLIFAFSLSGGISAFMAAFYIDSYDRKTVLLTAFFFFAIGSILCSFAHTYHRLACILLARLPVWRIAGRSFYRLHQRYGAL